ncbi:MAG: enoyl-CoA hydratase/isomerase family protein [Alphaproteobacteria bacterium]|nr:enoyl-CoA hydratase/isomerase family protein [Alphaproteobacteria bacterium]
MSDKPSTDAAIGPSAIASRDGSIGILTLNRPRALNALSKALMAEASAILDDFIADDGVHAIVVQGEGRAFSAGFDLKEGSATGVRDPVRIRKTLEDDFAFIMRFWDCPKPTIAAVHGYCLAGAFEIALACDITIAGEGSFFGEPEVRFGSGIVAMLLPWITGPKQAKEMLLTGADRLTARRMLEIGVVNQVIPDADVRAAAMTMARSLAVASPEAVRLTKRAIHRAYDIMGLRAALREALELDVEIETSDNPESAEFNRIRRTEGLAAAIAWRDSRTR